MPAKLDRCVADVKNDPGVDNPWAVCQASIKEGDDVMLPTKEAEDKCAECGKTRDEHGIFSDHEFMTEQELEEFEDDEDELVISIKLGETTDQGPKPMPPLNVVEDHELDNLDEAVSIGSGLSAQSVGAKKINEAICPCERFDALHKSLTS